VLRGLGGNDSLVGNGDADTLNGGAGDDTILGGVGDSVIGGSGFDVLRFGATPVLVDLLTGVHDGGADGMWIGGIERIEGSTGGDIMIAGGTRIVLDGGAGADTLGGGGRNDTLIGGAGNDSIRGNDANDVLRGGAGADTVRGDDGADIFVWGTGDLGTDLVVDFEVGVDRLAFEDGFLVSPVFMGTGALTEMLHAELFFGQTILRASVAGEGWQTIARFQGVSAGELNAAIADESILAVLSAGTSEAVFA